MNGFAYRRTAVALAALGCVASACGGDNGDTANPARFCEISHELEQLDDITTATPDAAADLASRTRVLLDEAENTSPDEIRSAVLATTTSYRELLDYYEDADFDIDPDEFEAAFEAGQIGVDPPEAADLFTWLDENCTSP